MSNRNVDKGREAENATARVFQESGCPGAERRTKRGGTKDLDCACQDLTPPLSECLRCGGQGYVTVPADAGDLTGIPGVVVQVKWSGYGPLSKDLQRTDEQRRVAGADVGLLVRKRKGVGLARAGEWDAYLPTWQLLDMLQLAGADRERLAELHGATWQTDLRTAARLIALCGYGTPALATR